MSGRGGAVLYLVRHADAVSDEVDPARPLSAKGRDQVGRVCGLLRRHSGFCPAEFWHSPLARARETAELLAKGMELASPVLLKPGLEPDDDPEKVIPALEAETRSLAVVGHEPHLGILASLMVHGPVLGGIYYPFQKAGVLALTRGAKRWRAEWIARGP